MTPTRLEHKGQTWNWDQYHKWSDRDSPVDPEMSLITVDTNVFGMGSCFADNVVRYLVTQMGLQAASFEESRFYDPVSVLQTVKHLLVEPQYTRDDLWVTSDGRYGNPFRNPRFRAASYDELDAWTRRIEDDARGKLRAANVIVITLGGTECWRHPVTHKAYITMPFPDVFNTQMPGIAEFHSLTFSECYAALEEIYLVLRRSRPDAQIVFTVSPVRLTFTTSGKDVRVATAQSKAILRAAIGELTDRYTDHVHYFESYEAVVYGPPGLNMYREDDVHVSELAVAIVMNRFARRFIEPSLRVRSDFALVEAMSRANDLTRLSAIQRLDWRYPAIRVLRSLGLEQAALRVYHLLRGW